MDLPRPSEDALAQPTRAQIFAFLVERRGPAGTEEIAEHFSRHPNGVRRHLERLEEGGFVTRGRVRGGQGRPRDSWAVSPDAHPGGSRPRAYADLARWLARATPAGPTRLRELERRGREIGRELAPAPDGDPVELFRDTIAALGFQPALDVKAEGGFTCSLENCPYRDSARENADVVCTLHRGITDGILAELDPEAELVRFEPRDPERAGCLVEVSGGASSA
ncbi:MAG TPA: helix-turn-helix domain-containing protein [Solirubrobacterales bacterium]|nr:helix-turn-helix domain-containing protein [Solirubrobacterales bacterium]